MKSPSLRTAGGDRLLPISSVVLAAVAFMLPPLVVSDTEGYLSNSIHRTPLYPMLLDLFVLLFGNGYGRPTTITQVLVTVFGAFRLASALGHVLDLRRAACVGILILLCLPVIEWGGVLIPDALGYGLFLHLLTAVLRGLDLPSLRRMAEAGGICALLLLTRPSYAAVVPALSLYFLGQAIWRRPRRPMVLGLVVALALGIGAGLFQRGYNLLVHGYFASSPLAGTKLLTVQIFLAEPEDGALFTEPRQRALWEDVVPGLDRRGLLARNTLGPKALALREAYIPICWDTLMPAYQRSLGVERPMTPQAWIDLGEQSAEMARTLIRAHPFRLMRHVVRSPFQVDGYYFLFVAVWGIVAFALAATRRQSFWFFAAFVAACAWGSYVLIGICAHMIPRYIFPTSAAVLACAVAAWCAPPTHKDGISSPRGSAAGNEVDTKGESGT